jgi:hypothetical protein
MSVALIILLLLLVLSLAIVGREVVLFYRWLHHLRRTKSDRIARPGVHE